MKMEDIQETGPAEEIKAKLLGHLKCFEETDWEIIGWHSMNMDEMRWRKPQKLSKSVFYNVIVKRHLEGQEIMIPKKISPEGLVSYVSQEGSQEESMVSESIFFSLWLVKDAEACIIAYGEHEFPNEGLNKALGRTTFSITFKKLKDILPLLAEARKRR